MKTTLAALLACTVTAFQPALAANTMASIVPGSCAKPVWPGEALRAFQEGKVMLGFLVDEGGKLRNTAVLRSSGSAALDRASVETLQACQFKAASEDDRSVARWARMQYVWTLSSTPLREAELSALERQARRGIATDQLTLGKIYLSGRAGQRNVENGPEWIRRAAEQGLPSAQVAMALTLIPSGRYVDTPEDSIAWLRKAAAQNHAAGQFLLGRVLLDQGKPEEAMPLLERAAAQQYPEAMALTATHLLDGARNEDLPRAVALLQQAAAKGNPTAHWMLAECYSTGRGVVQDDGEAARHYQQAASTGVIPAQFALARAYQRGIGVQEDEPLAALWRSVAMTAQKRKEAGMAE